MKNVSRLTWLLLAALCILPCTPNANAQGIITGSITGTVQDSSGAAIPEATLTATNVATGIVVSAKSGASGDFFFYNIPIGTYRISISRQGFSSKNLDNVVVEAGKASGLGVQKLSVGNVEVSVEVNTSQNLIETAQAQVTTTFDSQQIQNLPTGGGFDELALLIPGVVSTHGNNRANTNGAGISSNGQRGRSNNFEIDGQNNNDNSVTGPQVFFQNQDALQEVQVITNQFSAQYGRDAGSVINYVTKQGTNSFHGTAFEYYAGSWLNSLRQSEKSALQGFCPPGTVSTTALPCSTVKRPRYTDNQFGGSFGGPILRDKLFGFGSALFDRHFAGAAPVNSGPNNYFPTPASISALAAAYPNSAGVQSLVLYSPFAIKAGNPTLTGKPLSVVVTDGTTPTTIQVSQFSRFLPSYSTDEEVLGRLDYQATPHDRFFGRYFYQNNPTIPGSSSSTILTGGYVNVIGITHSVGADWTHTFTPHLTNQLRYSFQQSRVSFDGGGFSTCTISNLSTCPSSMGISTSSSFALTVLNPAPTDPAKVRTGSFGLSSTYPQGRIVKDTQIQNNANWTVGRHSIAFGGSYEFQNSPNVFLPNISGAYTLTGLNGLIQGVGTLGLAAGNANIHFTEPDFALYFQDDWKVTPSFTANLGLRYEYFGQSINLLHDLSLANQTGPNPLWNTALPLSVTTFPKANEQYKHFEPRIGFAWNPASHRSTVIRGGYAINITPAFYNIFTNSYGSAPVVLSATVSGCTSVGPTPKPCIPTGGSNYTSVHAQDTKYLPLGGNPGQFSQTLVNSNFRQPITQTYSIGVQREIGRYVVGEVRYVGAHTSGDFQSLNGNPNLAAVAASFPNIVSPSSICTTASSTLPGGVDVGHLNCGSTLVRLRANTAFEIYNGLQTQLTTRNYRGLTATLAYTWSRTIDNASEIFGTSGIGTTLAFSQNPLDANVGERGVSGNSFPNVTSLGLTYVAPWYSKDHRLVGKLLGGFQFNTIYLFNSGQPYTPYQAVGDTGGSFCDSTFALSFAGPDTCRPILANKNAPLGTVGVNTGKGVYVDNFTLLPVARSSEHWILNNTAEALAIGNPYGGVGRNTLRGDSFNNVDISVYKNTHINERVNVQLQFTLFNALNRAFYSAPDAQIEDSGTSFSNFTQAVGSNRNATVGARVLF